MYADWIRNHSGRITILYAVGLLLLILLQITTPATAEPAMPLSWASLDGPMGGPAQALAVSPNYPTDPMLLAGGNQDLGHGARGGAGLFRSLDGGLSWTGGFGPENGAVLDVAISANWGSDGIALAGLWQGIWGTTDGGTSWHALSTFPGSGPGAISAVAISPQFASDQSYLAGSAYGTVYRSTDAGATWSPVAGTSSVQRIVYHPALGSIALAATGNGLWRTQDGGSTWSEVAGGQPMMDVAFRPLHDTAYALTATDVLSSTDSGQTWSTMPAVGAASPLQRLAVSGDGTGLFVSAGTTLYRFDFGTNTWHAIANTPDQQSILRLLISPQFGTDQTLWLGTLNGVWISHDAGLHWQRSQGFFRIPVRVIGAVSNAGVGDDIFAGTSWGVWRRSSGQWQPKNAGLIGISASSVGDLAVSPDYANDQTVFATDLSGVSIGANLYKSTDRGDSWQRKFSAGSIQRIRLSPAFNVDGTAALTADQRLYLSTDYGETWAAHSYWDWTHTAQQVAFSPNFSSDHTLLVVGSSVYSSNDAGTTWHEAASPPPITAGDSPRWMPQQLAVITTGSGTWSAWLAITRYESTPPYLRHDQLWRSDDGGETWYQVITAPDRPITSIALAPDYPLHANIFLSTADDDPWDEDVIPSDLFYSPDGGSLWRNLGAVPDASLMNDTFTASGLGQSLLVGADQLWLLDPAGMPTATPNPCSELLYNRSFEYDGVWGIPSTVYPAQRSTDQHQQGWWSMQTGITDPVDNVYSYSDFFQTVTLPPADQLTLSFWRWPRSGTTQASAAASSPARSRLSDVAHINSWAAFDAWLRAQKEDLQYGMVITPDNQLHFLYADLRDDRSWFASAFDLTAYAGQTVKIQFGTFNNGTGAITAQYFDSFSLTACTSAPAQSPTPTWTPTNTPTWTPTPTLTPTWTPTLTPTWTPTLTPTSTPTWTPTQTPTSTPTQTSTPTLTPTQTSTPTLTPTQTSTPTLTPTQTSTPTLTPTSTPTPLPTIYLPLILNNNWTATLVYRPIYPVFALTPPRLPETVYVLDNQGRVWSSVDKGLSWQNLNIQVKLGAPALQMGGGLAPPYDLWVSTAFGLYVSHDQGQNWQHVSGYQPQAPITVDFQNADQLWSGGVLGSYQGVIRSFNGGVSWQSGGIGLSDKLIAYAILIDPGDQQTTFAVTRGLSGEQHLWRGQTSGVWGPINSPTGNLPLSAPRLGLALHESDGSLWAGGSGGTLMVSYNPRVSNGNAVSWQVASRFGSDYMAAPLAWSPSHSLYLLLWRYSDGYGAFLRSDNNGATWTQIFLP